MKFALLHVQSSSENWCMDACAHYQQKLKHFVPFDFLTLNSKKMARAEASVKVDLETLEIQKNLSSDDYVVLFDEQGKSFTSEQFAKHLEKILNSGKKRTVFIVGGAFGVAPSLAKKAHSVISLSSFVLSHQVAQVVVLEQLYRAFSILKNLPYHNARS